jgi:hypothetical protein
MLANKILTWDNYIKRGGEGPNICALCHLDVEVMDHLMIHYSFTKSVWMEILKEFDISLS